jgi:hypothetical protein
MNCGVAVAKTHNYPNNSYSFPSWLRERKDVKGILDVRNSILEKLGNISHSSKMKNKDFLLSYFTHMIRNNTYFAIKMKNKLNLSEAEIKYLLGGSHQHKLKEIILTSEVIHEKKISADIKESNEEEKSESMQQSLFDF